MVQSSRFLNEPGSAPAYSGVQNSRPSASASAARSSRTGSGSGSKSSSGLKWGNPARPSNSRVVTPAGATSAAVWSAATLVDPARRLPPIRRIALIDPTLLARLVAAGSGGGVVSSHDAEASGAGERGAVEGPARDARRGRRGAHGRRRRHALPRRRPELPVHRDHRG